MTNDLVVWLLEQIAEDEGQVRGPDRPSIWLLPRRWHGGRVWLPMRIRDECDAKRRIVEWLMHPHTDRDTREPLLRLLALPYADRPGCRKEWRP